MSNQYEQSDYIFNDILFIQANRSPCIICGHPTGDCSPNDGKHVKVSVANTFPSLNQSEMFLVIEDIVEERQITPFTKARVIVHPAGKMITVEEAKKFGLV
jgi:hypothetical protein